MKIYTINIQWVGTSTICLTAENEEEAREAALEYDGMPDYLHIEDIDVVEEGDDV